MSENGTFWKRSPKWINLKTPAKCVSVDSENGTFWKRWRHNSHVTLSQSLLNHWSKMADELLIMLLCLLSLWIACLEINVALYNLYATALHRRRNTVCSALLSNGPQQTLRRYRVRPYLERRFWTRPGRTSAWWDNFVHEVVIPEEWLENFRMSRRSLLNLSERDCLASVLGLRQRFSVDSETVWKRLMWTENILSVFAAKVAFSNLSGLVWT